MNLLSRIFRRTPSLRTRVAFATAIAAAIVVGIVGTIVWIGITNDRKERLDRRLDEAAGFAIPFLPRGLDEIPKSPNDQDAIITVRKGGEVTSNSKVILPELPPGYADTYVNGVRYRVRTVEIRVPSPSGSAMSTENRVSTWFKRKRPSPSALAIKASRASGVTGNGRSKSISARAINSPRAWWSSRRRISTWQRDSKAAFKSKLGFSVVAPTRVTVPAST